MGTTCWKPQLRTADPQKNEWSTCFAESQSGKINNPTMKCLTGWMYHRGCADFENNGDAQKTGKDCHLVTWLTPTFFWDITIYYKALWMETEPPVFVSIMSLVFSNSSKHDLMLMPTIIMYRF